MTKTVLGIILSGLALAVVVYNCGWVHAHAPKIWRRRYMIFTLVYLSFPVFGTLSYLIDSLTSKPPSQSINAIWFIVGLVVIGPIIVGYGISLNLLFKQALIRRGLLQ